jgi:hypothetical protein
MKRIFYSFTICLAVFTAAFSQMYDEVHVTDVKVDPVTPTRVDIKHMKKAGVLPDTAQSSPKPLYVVRIFLDGHPPMSSAVWYVAIGDTKYCYAQFRAGIFFKLYTKEALTDLYGKPLKLVSSDNGEIDLDAMFPPCSNIE